MTTRSPLRRTAPGEHLKRFTSSTRNRGTFARSCEPLKQRGTRTVWRTGSTWRHGGVGERSSCRRSQSADLPEAFEVIVGMLDGSSVETAEMVELLRKHHAASPDLGKLFLGMVQENGDDGRSSWRRWRRKARSRRSAGRRPWPSGGRRSGGSPGRGRGSGFGTKLTEDERQRMEARVREVFDDGHEVHGGPGDHGKGTVASRHAKAELAGLKNLSDLRVGKVCPDIAGRKRGRDQVQAQRLTREGDGGHVLGGVVRAVYADGAARKEAGRAAEGKPFALVGVNGDDKREKAGRWRRRAEMSWPSFWDAAERPEGRSPRAGTSTPGRWFTSWMPRA